MNAVAFIIIVALFADLVINGVADYLNLKAIEPEVPEQFVDVYDEKRYRKSQKYLRVNTLFAWVQSLFDLVIFLIFWFSEGFFMLDLWVRSFHVGPVYHGLIYIGILILLKATLSLPFSIYATFVIEERFGFNKTTRWTFFVDLIKGLGLGILFGVPLVAGVLSFFQYAGIHGWWLCWLAVTLYMLIVQYIAPTWIMPLFNKFKSLEEGEIKQALFSYAKHIRFPLKNVVVMDGSRRSDKSNAFFTGIGKQKRIVLFDTLINRFRVGELVAILAHEMGHFKKKHVLWNMVIGIVQTGIILYLFSLFITYQGLFDAFYVQVPSVYAGLIFFGMLYTPISLVIGIFIQIYSRKNEFQADEFAVRTTGNPPAMVDALKKLSAHNLTNLTPHPFYVFLNYSHPPLLERIRAISYITV